MEQTASELAVLLEGQVGATPKPVRKLAKIESAGPVLCPPGPTPNTSDFLQHRSEVVIGGRLSAVECLAIVIDFAPRRRSLPSVCSSARGVR